MTRRRPELDAAGVARGRQRLDYAVIQWPELTEAEARERLAAACAAGEVPAAPPGSPSVLPFHPPDTQGAPMPDDKPPTRIPVHRWTNVRIHPDVAARADALAETMSAGAVRASRTTVVAEALARGLDSLEAEHAPADTDGNAPTAAEGSAP